jgi:hypothetical protein
MTDLESIIFIKSPTGSISFLDGRTFEEIWEQDVTWLTVNSIRWNWVIPRTGFKTL